GSLLVGCYVEPAPPPVQYVPPPQPVVAPPPEQPVYVEPPPAQQPVYVEPAPQQPVYAEPQPVYQNDLPVGEPQPVGVADLPPPRLGETPGPEPFWGAVWIPGFWNWDGGWVWMSGRWATAPQPGLVWCEPYYENRGGLVIYVGGHWRNPAVPFAPPPFGVYV